MSSSGDSAPGPRDPWESLGAFRLSSERGAGGPPPPAPDEPAAPVRKAAPQPVAANLTAPMPGEVVAVLVAPGDRVMKGQDLVVLEAMKMEHAIKAPIDGMVEAVRCAVGDRVDNGQKLVDLVQPENSST